MCNSDKDAEYSAMQAAVGISPNTELIYWDKKRTPIGDGKGLVTFKWAYKSKANGSSYKGSSFIVYHPAKDDEPAHWHAKSFGGTTHYYWDLEED